MPQVWTLDDLRFANVRAAHFESAEHVAGDLLAAANKPGSRLKGVTAADARLRAADLLIASDDRDRAAIIARQVLQDVRGRREKLAAACALARAGDQDAVKLLATPALRTLQDRPSDAVIMDAVALALGLADGGQCELAVGVADEAIAGYDRWRAGAGGRAARSGTLGNVVALARQTVLAAGQAQQDLITGRRADEPGMQPALLPSWPAMSGSYMLWWPEGEYQRLVRQVPDVRSVLGATWRDHTATVESAMLALVPTGPGSRTGGATGYWLAAADFEGFCGYLEFTRADPRQASTMTGHTARLVFFAESGVPDARPPTPWPPAEDSRCWCGSKARYRRCCLRA